MNSKAHCLCRGIWLSIVNHAIEHIFRFLRADYPWRFIDVTSDFPDRTEKTWKIKQK